MAQIALVSNRGNARFDRLESQMNIVIATLAMVLQGTNQADAAQANVQTMQEVMQ